MASPFQNLPAQRRLLQAIASGEANDYNVIYGGGRFNDFSDHPRQAVPIKSGPNAGKTSSAAGLYQFIAPTWDQVRKELNLPDFSQDSQDRGAWHLAATTYERKTGRDLLADMEAGNTKDIAPALAPVWTSIPGGIEPNGATGGFMARLGSDAPAGQAPPAGLLAPSAGDPQQAAQAQGLLAQLTSEPQQPAQGQDTGLLAGLQPQQQQQEAAPADMAQAPSRRKPINIAGLQALLQRPRLGAGWRV